jgi:hypothetical protein
VNLKDISRLKSTKDSFQLSIDILAEILKTVPFDNAQMMKGKGKGKGESGDGDGENDDLNSAERMISNLAAFETKHAHTRNKLHACMLVTMR